jgi:hypothetical protein
MPPLTLQVPTDLDFAALDLRRDPVTREVLVAWEPIERICEVSGVDPQIFLEGHEDNVSRLIVAWYDSHRKLGGAPDAVAEQLLAEVVADELYGEINVQSGGSGKPQ